VCKNYGLLGCCGLLGHFMNTKSITGTQRRLNQSILAITNFGNFGNEPRVVPLMNRNMEHHPEHRIVLQPRQLAHFVPCSGSLCDFEWTVINGSMAGLTGNRESVLAVLK